MKLALWYALALLSWSPYMVAAWEWIPPGEFFELLARVQHKMRTGEL